MEMEDLCEFSWKNVIGMSHVNAPRPGELRNGATQRADTSRASYAVRLETATLSTYRVEGIHGGRKTALALGIAPNTVATYTYVCI